MFDSFNRGQKLTILVFALSNFCAAVCVSLQVRIYSSKHFLSLLVQSVLDICLFQFYIDTLNLTFPK